MQIIPLLPQHTGALERFARRNALPGLRSLAQPPDFVSCWVLLDASGAVRGHAELHHRFWRALPLTLFVEPPWRGRGYGSQLLRQASAFARARFMPGLHFESRCGSEWERTFEHWGARRQSRQVSGTLTWAPATPEPAQAAGWTVLSHAQTRDLLWLAHTWHTLTGSGDDDLLEAVWGDPRDVLTLLDAHARPQAMGWLSGNTRDHPMYVDLTLAVSDGLQDEGALRHFLEQLGRLTTVPVDLYGAPYPPVMQRALTGLSFEQKAVTQRWFLPLSPSPQQEF